MCAIKLWTVLESNRLKKVEISSWMILRCKLTRDQASYQGLTWSRMCFKAKRSRSITFAGASEIQDRRELMPAIKEKPVTSKEFSPAWRWFLEVMNQAAEDGIRKIDDPNKLPGKCNLVCIYGSVASYEVAQYNELRCNRKYPKMAWSFVDDK